MHEIVCYCFGAPPYLPQGRIPQNTNYIHSSPGMLLFIDNKVGPQNWWAEETVTEVLFELNFIGLHVI